jgi:hypothetical protein
MIHWYWGIALLVFGYMLREGIESDDMSVAGVLVTCAFAALIWPVSILMYLSFISFDKKEK